MTKVLIKTAILLALIALSMSSLTLGPVSINQESQVSSVAGSVMGGTTLFIKGTGFNTFDPTQNSVMVGDYPCNIIEGVTETTLSCETTSIGSYKDLWNQEIKVTVDGTTVTSTADFDFRTDTTPILYNVNPAVNFPGKDMQWYGAHRIFNLGDGRSDSSIYGLWVDQLLCSRFDIIQENINANGGDYIKAFTPIGQKAGRYSLKEHVFPGYAYKYVYMAKSTLDTITPEYDYVVMPAVDSFTKEGAIGGNTITVKGTGFSPIKSQNIITIGEVPCSVQSASNSELICTLAAKGTESSEMISNVASPSNNFESGAGFSYQRYGIGGMSSKNLETFKEQIDNGTLTGLVIQEDTIRGEIKSVGGYGAYYGQVWKGYFVAPVDGTYTFRGLGDDMFSVYLSNNSHNSTVTYDKADSFLRVNSPMASNVFPNWYESDMGQSSERTIDLVAYNRYYMEVYHMNMARDGWFELGIEIPNTDASIKSFHSYEVHKLKTELNNEPQIVQYNISSGRAGTYMLRVYKQDDQTFKVLFDENTTIAYDATADVFCQAIKRFTPFRAYLASCSLTMYDSDFLVTDNSTKARTFSYTVTIEKLRPVDMQSVDLNIYKQTSNTSKSTITKATLQEHSPLMSGTFQLSLGADPIKLYNSSTNAYDIVDIPYNVDKYLLQRTIRAFGPGLENTMIRNFGDCDYSCTWVIYYIRYQQDLPVLKVELNNLKGGTQNSATITSSVRRDYSTNLLVEPIDYRFMTTASGQASVRITVNGIPSACLNDCAYTFIQEVPEVTDASISGKTLSITMTVPASVSNSKTTNDLIVYLDNQPCTINTGGALDSFTCDLPVNNDQATPILRAGDHYPIVQIVDFGTILINPNVNPISVDLTISSLNPTTGGQNGGFSITVAATGLPAQISECTFTLCGQTATIESINNMEAIINAPACANTATPEELVVSYNSLTASQSFTYSGANTQLKITSIYPSSASPVLKAILIIAGQGFGSIINDITVHLSNSSGKIYELRVLKVNNTLIEAGLSGGLPGKFDVIVNKANQGNAIPDSPQANDFTYEVVVDNISPLTGSVYGGTLLTITGRNFVPRDVAESMVTIGDELNQLCAIQSITTTQIKCRTPPKHADEATKTNLIVLVNNKLIIDSTCGSGANCYFQYMDDTEGPRLDQANEITARSATTQSLTIRGTGFELGGDCKAALYNRVTKNTTVVTPTSCNDTQLTFSPPADIESGFYLVKARTSDQMGESNGTALNIGVSITSITPPSLSTEGGKVTIDGSGFPGSWPNTYYNEVSLLTVNGIAQILDIQSISPSQIVLNIPKGYNMKKYMLQITNVNKQWAAVNFTMTTATTPTAQLTSAASVAPGVNSISLNRTILPAVEPETIQLFSTTNSDAVVSVSSPNFAGSQIKFDVTLKSGQYGFRLYDDLYGWYYCGSTIDVSQTAPYTLTSFQTSFNGGMATINGENIGEGAIVTVNGQIGTYVSGTATDAVFSVPKLITPTTQSQFSLAKNKTLDISTKTKWSDTTSQSRAFDSDHATSYSGSNTGQCYIGVDFGEGAGVFITRIRYFPSTEWTIAYEHIKGGQFQASNDNATWTTIGIIDQTVHAGWNSIMVEDTSVYRYVRFIHDETSQCKLAEFEISGIEMATTTVLNTDSHKSDLIFFDGVTTQTFTEAVEYRKDKTPIVTDVSPKNGNVFGGYNITLTGENLNIGAQKVTIDGQDCPIIGAPNASQIMCTVPERKELPENVEFIVQVGSSQALTKASFNYVLRWSELSTWGTDPYPIDDDLIWVPKGMHLLVDQSTPILASIVVQGVIQFEDTKDMVIQANTIIIRGGKFIAGTAQNPHQNNLKFIMHGNYWGAQLPIFGNKGIGCFECDFSMYGKPRQPTWTVLDGTINANTDQFTVLDDVDWAVGEQIVVASTSFDHNEAQQKTIKSINGKVIKVQTPFKYMHFGDIETYGTDSLNMRAEVGLLTRNIQMMGDETSVQTDYGSHLLLAGSSENGFVGKVAYTEFTKCGQPQILGRYCHHFHMNGDVPDSYSIGNSVHQSMARILTVHGVHFLYVAWNVGYRVQGHNFFIQDGIETNNVLEYNLAIGSLSSNKMLQTDISVASYWITNPSNHLRFNRAAGGQFYGFWYEIKQRPDGPSSTEDVCPQGMPLGQSHDNVAHSYLRFGLRIFRLSSRENPCAAIRNDKQVDPWKANPSIESKFYNYVTYKNGQSGLLAEETGHTVFENFTIAENVLAGMEFYRNNLTRQDVKAINIVIIGKSTGNPSTNASVYNGFGAILPRTGSMNLENIRFSNFVDTQTVWQACSKCDNLLLYTSFGAVYSASKIQYSDINGSYYEMLGLKREIFLDLDGSLTNTVFDGTGTRSSATLVFGFPHLALNTACVNASTIEDWGSAIACDGSVSLYHIGFTNLQKRFEFIGMPIKILPIANIEDIVPQNPSYYTSTYSLIGNMDPKESKQTYSFPFIAGENYQVWWADGIDFDNMAMITSHLYKQTDDATLFKFNYTDNREIYEIGALRQGKPLIKSDYIPKSTSLLDSTTCSNGDYYHINTETERKLHLCASGKGVNKTEFEYISVNAIYCRYLCPAPPGQFVKENFVRLWSNATQWPEARMPVAGENVSVHGNWTIIMDVNPAVMDYLEVDGDIIIEDDNAFDLNITANNIWIKAGSIKAGSSTAPISSRKITFQINGYKQGKGVAIDKNLVGNKMFVVSGDLHLYGTSPKTTATKLKAFASAGDTQIKVQSVEGWVVGDIIGIAPSFSKRDQFEKVTITSIDTSSNTVTFTPALKYSHYGAEKATIQKSYGTLDTRAGVVHLNRNIKITSGPDSDWGYTLVQYGLVHPDNQEKILTGNLIIDGVQFEKGGQLDTEEAALQMKNIRVNASSTLITKSTFHECRDLCVNIENVHDVEFSKNNFFDARKFHVQVIDMSKFVFTSNLMIGVTSRPSTVFSDFIACFQAYKYFDVATTQVSVTNNLCQGSSGHGFAIPTVPCADIEEYPFTDNIVGSAQVGYILGKSVSSCVAAKGLNAYATGVGQIMNPPTSELRFKNFIMAENGRSVILRIGGTATKKTAHFNDSYITAISRPGCAECYGTGATECTSLKALQLLTVGSNTQSLPDRFGAGFDVICKAETIDAKSFSHNIEFAQFKQAYTNANLTQCSSNVVFVPHRGADDITGSHHFWNTTCANCELEAMAKFKAPSDDQLGWSGGCGEIHCTGYNNYMIFDYDGTFLPQRGMLLANNSWIGEGEASCTKIDAINGYYCTDLDFAVLAYESIAPDHDTRQMWPVYLKYEGGNWTSVTNAWIEWEWEANQPLNRRKGRFLSILKLHKTYNMTFTSMPPEDMVFEIQRRLPQGNASDWAIIKLHYPKPNSIRVQANGVTIKPIKLLDNDGEDALDPTICGSNKFFYQNYTIHFAVNGHKDCRVRVGLVNSVQLTARFNMPIKEFFDNDGETKYINRLASILGINDTSRIKIVGVYSGSIIIVTQIDEDLPEDNSENTLTDKELAQKAAESRERSQAIAEKLNVLIATSQFAQKMAQEKLFEEMMSVEATSIFVSDDKANTESQDDTAFIIGVVFAAMILTFAAITGGIYYMRKRAKIEQFDNEEVPVDSNSNKDKSSSDENDNQKKDFTNENLNIGFKEKFQQINNE